MLSKNEVKISRLLSRVLRHEPQIIGLELDIHGWADVEKLLLCLKHSGLKLDSAGLEKIVRENDKQRFSFNDNKTKIRANQGHSIHVDVELRELQPPETLYHGTAQHSVESIMKTGINKAERLYVHLSSDEKTAVKVGKRHGKPVVLKINAADMYNDGYKFFLSENNVWLCNEIPVKYISILKWE